MQGSEKLEEIAKRYEELQAEMNFAPPERYAPMMKEIKKLEPVCEAYSLYKRAITELEGLNALINSSDAEMRELAKSEEADIREKIALCEQHIKELLLPRDENDSRNVILEIRAGTGGDEAALFAADLFRMYSMYAQRKRWKTELISVSETDIGGIKELCMSVSGNNVYAALKYESGVHRVQRVPETENSGRIHTSAVTVAVLPEAEEVDVVIDPGDLQIDTYRSGGAGGQHVNKTESAIRITHIPTGIVVECQDERSQHKNKERAMKVLRSKLYEQKLAEAERERSENRRRQVGSGDRSERIRTYNFPQGRVSDHRIGLTIYKLDDFLVGGPSVDEVLEALAADEKARLLSGESE